MSPDRRPVPSLSAPSTAMDRSETVKQLPGRECRCKGDGATWADTTSCSVHDEATSPLARAVAATYEQGVVEALRWKCDVLLGALRVIDGPADNGPWIEVYRKAGGGYEGLQAIAREALEAVGDAL